MKYISLILLALLLAASCVINIGGAAFVGVRTEEGIDYTEVRGVKPFRGVASSLPCNVYYVQSDKLEVRVESTKELADKVIAEVENGKLFLKLESGRYPKLIMRVIVSSPDIESLQVSGSGDLISEDALHTDGTLSLKVSGSGTIRTGSIDSKELTAHCSGSGSLTLSRVSSRSLSASVSGSGDIRLNDVSVAGEVNLRTSGSGDITVHGSCQNVSATVSGSGSISGELAYENIRTSKSGSGSIRL